MADLIIDRYEKDDNSIFSHVVYRDENIRASFEGIEAAGYEIEKGTYTSSYTDSPKFGRKLYSVAVDGRQGIRIHVGNSYKDTTGCVIIGEYRRNDIILNSKRAVNLLHRVSQQRDLNIIVNEKFSRQNSSESFRTFIRDFIERFRALVKN